MIGDNIMLAVPVADSFEYNIEFDLYAGEKNEYGYIGLYANKSIRAVGKITKVVTVEEVNGELKIYGDVTDDEKNRLCKYKEKYENKKRTELKEPDYFFAKAPKKILPRKVFFVDKFYETDYRNIGTTGVIGSKKFPLAEILSPMPTTTKEIADELRNRAFPSIGAITDDKVKKIMLAVSVKNSYEENIRTNTYCDDKKGIYGYLGLYKDKSICAVGRVTMVASIRVIDGKPYIETPATNEVKNIICENLKTWKLGDKDNLSTKMFFVDKFYETNYENTTTVNINGKEQIQGIIGSKKFFLDNLLPATTEEIAYQLDGQTWELGQDITPKLKSSSDKKNELEIEEKETEPLKPDVANKSSRLIDL